jgi:radical SAM superfamily enzyme YgiQ (UPF0313 family)
VLEKINKGIKLEDIGKVIHWTKKRNIKALGFFLIGAPGDTRASVKKTIDFAKELGLDYAQFHKVMAKPRTDLYEEIVKATNRDYWREFVLGTAGEERLPSPWTELSQQEIEDLTIGAYHDFYFRPRYLMKTVMSIRSLDELKRYLRSALGLFTVKSDLSQGTL